MGVEERLAKKIVGGWKVGNESRYDLVDLMVIVTPKVCKYPRGLPSSRPARLTRIIMELRQG
jgi:hypothetical protein